MTRQMQNKTVQEQAASGKSLLAVVRVRGTVRQRPAIKHTLALLKLHKKNACVIIPKAPNMLGMLNVIKDYVTWGEVQEETRVLLLGKKGKKGDAKEKANLFHLSPPRKGYGRKGVKEAFSNGGALGDRGEKINDLLKRMLS